MEDAVSSMPTKAFDNLRARGTGALLTPGDAAYEEARAIWNAMIDRRPAAILRCDGPEDVAAGLAAASEAGLPVAVKGGGHNIAGAALIEGGLTLDLSGRRGVEVDPTAKRAVVEPGALLGDLDKAAAAHGLAIPLGINSTTGVAGLTLGGGYGWLTRRWGLTVDSLAAAEVVTPAGERLRASRDENPDLFWGLRGGGGNLAVATRFEFDLHPLPHDVTAGLIIHPGARAVETLQALRDVAPSLPEALTVWAVLRQTPPLPFLDASQHGAPIVALACCWSGDPYAADAALAPVRAIGFPLAEAIGPQPYAVWQTAFDPLSDHGARNYWKSHMFEGLEDSLIDVFAEALDRLPGPECEVFVAQLGGTPARLDPASTSYPHRNAAFMMNVHARWRDPADDMRCIAWAREFFDRTEPFSTGGVYSNFMPEDEAERAPNAFGASYERLVRLKAVHDPRNVLRSNASIASTA
jgi:FAD/FMN-containing dehydrogenase